jgi:uncharacterized protein (TIGR03083 family)
VNYEEYCNELDREVDRFAVALANADFAATVPSCPEWSVRDLAEHLGVVHRWAQELVRVRATQRITPAAMGVGAIEVDEEWLRSGGHSLVETLRTADPDEPMWAWGADQHVRFWARRQLHETMVHRMDLELAMGVASSVDSVIALDAVDEFLDNLTSDRDISVRARPERAEGESLEIRTADSTKSWGVELSADGYEFVDALSEPDAILIAEPPELLAVLLRRRPVGLSDVEIEGDESLVDHWLRETAFQ